MAVDRNFEARMQAHQEESMSSLFDTPGDKAAAHAYAVIQQGGWEHAKLTGDQLKLLRMLADCRGRARAMSIDSLERLLRTNARQIKADVHDLREVFHVRIGSSRDGEGGGFYLITTVEEALDTARPLWNQALAMQAVVKSILEPHEMRQLEQQRGRDHA